MPDNTEPRFLPLPERITIDDGNDAGPRVYYSGKVVNDMRREMDDLRKAHAGLKQSYKNLHKTLTLKDHIIKTREWERDVALEKLGATVA